MNIHKDPLLMTLRAVQSTSPTATISDATTIISTRTKIRRNILLVLSAGNHSSTKDPRPNKNATSNRGSIVEILQHRRRQGEAKFHFLLEQLLPNIIRQDEFFLSPKSGRDWGGKRLHPPCNYYCSNTICKLLRWCYNGLTSSNHAGVIYNSTRAAEVRLLLPTLWNSE